MSLLSEAPPANSPESAPSGGEGCLGCLGLIVLLIVLLILLGVMFRPSGSGASSLNPSQRAELSRLAGIFERRVSPKDLSPTQWGIDWQVHFFLDNANQLKCECAPSYIQNHSTPIPVFIETVDVQYQDSGKPGYTKIASSRNHERWNIYVESAVLKSEKEITTIIIYDDDWGQFILHRR
jgi:hypothetical protein